MQEFLMSLPWYIFYPLFFIVFGGLIYGASNKERGKKIENIITAITGSIFLLIVGLIVIGIVGFLLWSIFGFLAGLSTTTVLLILLVYIAVKHENQQEEIDGLRSDLERKNQYEDYD